MNSCWKIESRRLGAWLGCAVLLASLAFCPIGRAAPEASGDQLRLVIILTRHGVRSPLETTEAMAQFAAQPWPKWDVAPGIQTQHGNKLIALLGDYYRARFTKEHLLSGDAASDGPLVFVRADNDQRTIETGRILGKALIAVGEPDVHALPEGTVDPLFRPFEAQLGHPDSALAVAAVLGRVGGDPRILERAYAVQLEELKGVLRGAGTGPVANAFDTPTTVTRGPKYFPVQLGGPFTAALYCTDYFLLEYTEGMPPQDVGWGRVDGKVMTDLLTLHELYFDLTQRTFYLAQLGGSNIASHIVDTLEQCALGQPIPGALGPSGERIVVLAGHDTNIANMGGLLGMNWCISGSQFNPTLPGGALVFELWKRGGQENAFFVRTSYVAQTLEQMREATPLSLEAPPACSPIFIPGCGGPARDFDAPLAAFVRQARRVIDPAFIAPEP
jgi:4-phytase / acid phosphatase